MHFSKSVFCFRVGIQHTRHNVANMSRQVETTKDLLGDIVYKHWWETPRVSNKVYRVEEFRFVNRAIDDYSLCELLDNLAKICREIQQAIESRESNMWPHGRDILQRLEAIMDRDIMHVQASHMPPIYIPSNYPTDNVSQGHAQSCISHYAGDGTSHNGDGTSHQDDKSSFQQTGPAD